MGARFALGPEVLFNKDVSFHVHDTLSGRLEWFDAVKGCTGVVNLAGSPISTRWDADVKRGLLSSRITATKLVVDSINALPEADRPPGTRRPPCLSPLHHSIETIVVPNKIFIYSSI